MGAFLTFNLISAFLSPPPLSTPYPSNSYNAKTAAQYFSTRTFTQFIRVLEITGLSAGFFVNTLVLDKLFGSKGGVEEEKLGEVRFDEERSDSKSIILPSYITSKLPLVASLLASPMIPTPFAIRFAHRRGEAKSWQIS